MLGACEALSAQVLTLRKGTARATYKREGNWTYGRRATAEERELSVSRRFGDPAAIVDLVARGAAALAALGEATGAPLVPPVWQAVHDVARAHEGAAKSTGAGGGDLLLAVFPNARAAQAFRQEIAARGMTPVTCAVSPSGVDLQPPRETSKFPEIP